jgi:multiple sugar transport system substrate-binding protein
MRLIRASRAALVCAVAALLLAGCGRGGGAAAGGSVPAGKVTGTITMWAQGTEGQDLSTLIKGFEEENPGVTVNVTAIPWGDAYAKYQAAVAAGTTPDVAQLGTTWMADFAGALQNVPSGIDTGAVFAGAKAPVTVNGAVLGVPWYVDTRVIYYRTDLARKAGYDAPPTTLAGLEAMARAMQTKAGARWGIDLPANGSGAFQSMLPFVWSEGASLMNGSGTQWTLDSPAMVDALKYYQSYFAEGIADPDVSSAAGAAESAFVSGDTPMMINDPAEVSAIDQAGGAGFASKYSVMAIPAGASSTSFVGGGDLVVFRDCAHSAAAWKFVQYLTQTSVEARWYTVTGDLPALRAAWNAPALTSDAKFAVFEKQLESVQAPPNNTAWIQVGADADTRLEQIVNGASVTSALSALQQSAALLGTGN